MTFNLWWWFEQVISWFGEIMMHVDDTIQCVKIAGCDASGWWLCDDGNVIGGNAFEV